MIIKNFPYLLRRKSFTRKDDEEGKMPFYINRKFGKLMDLVGKAIKDGKKVKFVYKDNRISVSWED